jgi:4-amino-4-deoxy-L-arabinose transferase-like glycosyltransferase
VVERLHAARVGSVLWGAAGAIFTYFAGLWFFGRRSDGALLGLAFALQPMIVFVTGVVNNDAAALAAAAGCWAALAALVREKESRRALIALCTLALLGVLTKPTFTLCFPIFASGCVLVLGARRLASWVRSIFVFLPALAAEMAWRIHAWAPTESGLSGGGTAISPGQYLRSALDLARLREVWIDEYWMTWAWLDLRLPLQQYRAITAFLLLAAVGLCLAWRTLDRQLRAVVAFTAGSTLVLVAMLMGLEYAVVRRTPQESFLQGRYLLTLFPPQAAVAVIGLRGLSDRIAMRIDAAWTLPLLLVALDVGALATLLLRFYHA